MATVTAPLLSFGASGQIAKSQVYSTWKGRPYVRRHVTPANPRSVEQVTTRDTFSWLNNVWKVAPEDFRAAWTLAAKGQVMTDRNLFVKKNLPILRPLSALTGIIMSPGAKGGLSGEITITPGDDQISIAGVPADPLPSGWMVTRFIGAAIEAQDPQSGLFYDIAVGDDDTDPYTVLLTGLKSATHYLAAGWFEYQKSSLATDLAYGPATGVDYVTT